MPDPDDAFRRLLSDTAGMFAMPTANEIEQRARSRRNRHRITTGVAAAVAIVAIGSGAALALGGDDNSVGLNSDPLATPTVTATPSPTPTATRPGAYLTVQLRLTSKVGAPNVTFEALIMGRIPQFIAGSTGRLVTSDSAETKYTRINWDDNTLPGGSDGGDIKCGSNTPLVPVNEHFTGLSHSFAKPGHYTITFETYACPPVGKVVKTLDIIVR